MNRFIRFLKTVARKGRAEQRPIRRRALFVELLEERALLDGYVQTNLVSDLPGMAQFQDPNLVNPWGIVASPTGPFWVSDNGTGVSTLYDGSGNPIPLVVNVPPPAGGSPPSAPTGIVFSGSSDFVVSEGESSGPSRFIFATENGTISGWSPFVDLTNAILAVDNSASGAVYKGLALANNGSGNLLYATNFTGGTVDVFDSHFAPVQLSGSFTDPNLPEGYAPFGIQSFPGGNLVVTYALRNGKDDVHGPGHGFVDLFDTNGNLLRRVISQGELNSPWGLALAARDFGTFSNDLLVGNFGDGRINAYSPGGVFLGPLTDTSGNPIAIDGLWGLVFGNGHAAGATNTLFFTAGINDEADGLFGSLQFQSSTTRPQGTSGSPFAVVAVLTQNPGQTGSHASPAMTQFTASAATQASLPESVGSISRANVDTSIRALPVAKHLADDVFKQFGRVLGDAVDAALA